MMVLPASMQKLWQAWAARYQALSVRERGLVAAAAIGLLAYLGGVLWAQPMFSRAASFGRQAAAQEADLTVLQTQIQILSQQVASDPDAPLRQELAVVEQQIAEAEARLAAFNESLVPPDRAAALLEGLVRRHPGVRVAGFKTLPAQGILAARDKQRTAAEKQAELPPRSLDVYQHGFELKLRGNYLDILAYLKTLEAQPQRLLWQRAQLSVPAYPEAELTLTVSTLSMDAHWLEL